MDRERFEPGGRECPLIWRANVSVSGRGRRWPTRFRWRAALFRERRGKPATGPGFFPRPPKCGRGAGHRAGPVADMAGRKRPARVRAGTRAKSISRGLSGSRPEQSGRRALKRGRWISQPSCHAGRRLSDAGQHPARSGPRALSATHRMSGEPGRGREGAGFPTRCRPLSQSHQFRVAGGTFAERLSCPRLRHRRGAA
jgi:hypothetical protein